ncbi:MAG: hypothetical protein QOG82_2661 [Actinomycetota bacterium]|nr:hypothetical protein [Actinomycetota bacterium]
MTRRATLRRPALLLATAVAWLLLASLSAPSALAADDPLSDEQWGLVDIGAADAWSHATGEGIVIGIVDSGVDASHPDLAGKIDAVATCVGGPCREGTAPDVDGHGTAVAGVAAAVTGNGEGISGVAPDAHLVVAKALDDDGFGRIEDINNAIIWVVDHGADVVNLSLGDPRMTVVSILGTPLGPAIEYAWTRGAVTVLAAGNYDDGVTGLSPNYGDIHAVVVGSTDETGTVTDYSTSLGDAAWGLVAPGGIGDGVGDDILTTAPGGRYWSVAGTSFAAPHVSGTLALLLSEGLAPQAAVDRLLGTLDHSTSCGEGCRGRLRAGAAATPPPPVAPVDSVVPAPVTPADAGLDPVVIGLVVALLAVIVTIGVGFGVARRRSSARTPPWTPSASSDEHRSAA